ncbi:fibroblast growth factor 1-like [Paramuricea clavata]|nr:fibroblast growth factor 1-like [Paramuricea clavata]
MRFIIAIVLGTLMFQASPLQLPRDAVVRTRWNFERTTLENAFDHTREKRSVQGSEQQTNIRIVRIYHHYHYFLQVSKGGKVGGTKDIKGNVYFRMETYGTSLVRLYNIAAKLYIAINKRGVVITEKSKTDKSLFQYSVNGGFVRFSLAKYKRDTWLLTLKKNGKVKNARRTNPNMKATIFLLF